jgi:hypothetical protein
MIEFKASETSIVGFDTPKPGVTMTTMESSNHRYASEPRGVGLPQGTAVQLRSVVMRRIDRNDNK